MSDKIRAAVVGVGHLGQHHARILSGLPGVELVGVVDSRPTQAAEVAGRCGTTAFSDYRDLLDRVDAVSIAVPTTWHREVAAPFLEKGISTLIEKPLAPTAADARFLVDLARKSRAILQVGHIERFNPALSALDGLDLRPRFISAERSGTYTFRSTDIGVVLDLMIHDLDLVLSRVPAPPVLVSAVGRSVFGGHEDIADARVEFADGCVANFTASRVSMQATRKMRVWGDEAYAMLDFGSRQGTLVRPGDRLRNGEVDLDGLDLSQPARIKDHVFGKILRVDQVHVGPGGDALTAELEDFVNAVRNGGRPRVGGEDGLRAVELAEMILTSLRSHRWEGVPARFAVGA